MVIKYSTQCDVVHSHAYNAYQTGLHENTQELS